MSLGHLSGRRFRTIVADPPWRYKSEGVSASAAAHYSTMSEEQIAALPIASLAEDDAHLYLWTTNAFFAEAHRIAAAWGFEQKTVLTWIKDRSGCGFYFLNSTEHILFCVRGRLRTVDLGLSTHFHAPRREHSRKPRTFFQIVEASSPGPYLELFARERREGWEVFGNEVENTILELPFGGGALPPCDERLHER